ncbi:DNA polymerase III subunit gamma/tau, partial [Francisella tularensis subsp. holarctica]|nr:DNA polymerase III subunit gamma/tau [Francisella tularensis subsp. holarctica]
AKISIEQAHFLYQLTINAKKDIALAPNFEPGVTMAILRLIAFQKKNLIDNIQTSKSNISPIVSKNDIKLLKITFKSE